MSNYKSNIFCLIVLAISCAGRLSGQGTTSISGTANSSGMCGSASVGNEVQNNQICVIIVEANQHSRPAILRLTNADMDRLSDIIVRKLVDKMHEMNADSGLWYANYSIPMPAAGFTTPVVSADPRSGTIFDPAYSSLPKEEGSAISSVSISSEPGLGTQFSFASRMADPVGEALIKIDVGSLKSTVLSTLSQEPNYPLTGFASGGVVQFGVDGSLELSRTSNISASEVPALGWLKTAGDGSPDDGLKSLWQPSSLLVGPDGSVKVDGISLKIEHTSSQPLWGTTILGDSSNPNWSISASQNGDSQNTNLPLTSFSPTCIPGALIAVSSTGAVTPCPLPALPAWTIPSSNEPSEVPQP